MNNSHSLQEKIVKGSLTVLVLGFLGSIFAYLIRIFYSRTLTIENYGLFYTVFGLFNAATTYMHLGFGYSIVYLLPKYIKLKNYPKAWNIFVYGQITALIVSIVISIIIIFSAPFLARNFFKVVGSETLIYMFCIYLVVFTVINGLIQIYSGLQKEKYYSLITVSRWLLTLIFSLLVFTAGFSNTVSYATAWFLGNAITALVFLLVLYNKYSFLTKNRIYWEANTFKQMSSFAFPALLEIIVTSLVITEVFFLTLFKGVKEVGVYNVIAPLASVSVIFLAPINTLLLPLVSHLMEGEKKKMKYLMEKILEIGPFVGMYFALFTISFPSQIIGFIFGQKWLGPSEFPLIILSLGTIGILMSGILGAIVSGTGKIKKKLKVTTIITVISVVLNAFFIWRYGVLGAVITISIAAFILSFSLIKIIKTIVFFQIPYWFYLKLLIFSSIIFGVIKFVGIYPKSWFEFILTGLIYTLCFTLLGYLLRIYDKKEIELVISLKNYIK